VNVLSTGPARPLPSARRLTLVAAATLVAATACSVQSTEGAVTASIGGGATAQVTAPEGLEEFYTQSVAWESCAEYGLDGPILDRNGADCGYVTVPLDYDAPDGATAQIAVSRLAARDDRIGALLVNPGGPGGSGLSTALAAAGTDLADRFDIVGFDPRGIGSSTPAVRCLTAGEIDAERALDDGDRSPAGIEEAEKRNREYAQSCAERTGTEVLAHVGTADVVRDMDVIRAVLGDDGFNYLGYSYGTRLGTVYAETFPDRVRAMVLDGAIDPEQDPVDEIVLQAEGFQKAFDDFAASCATRRECALGTDPDRAVARFRQLVDPLIGDPADTADPRGLSHRDAITGVQQALYSQALWGSLRSGLAELADGRGDTLLLLADLYEGRQDDGTYSNVTDAFNAVRCIDDQPITDRAVAAELDVRYRQAAPFLDDGRGTGEAPLDVCAFWPVPSAGDPHTPHVPGLAPVLVVSTTGDPATPYRAGVDLARQLGGALVTFEGTQHTVVLDGERCVDDVVTSYFIDLAVPDTDPHC